MLMPDNDEAGRKHMAEVGARLQGIAAEVVIYEHAGDAKPGEDMADVLFDGLSHIELHEMAGDPKPTPAVINALSQVKARLRRFAVPRGPKRRSRTKSGRCSVLWTTSTTWPVTSLGVSRPTLPTAA